MAYGLLSTEILTAIIGLLLLVVGLIFSRSGQKISGLLGIVAMLVVLAITILDFGAQQIYFDGVYQVDPFSSFFKIVFIAAALLVMLMGDEYGGRFAERGSEFNAFLILATVGMMLLASAGDLITAYLGLELMTITFYILTAYLKDDAISAEAGMKYLILGAVSSGILLFGISLVMAMSGTTIITDIAISFSATPAMLAGIVLIIAGFGFKIALMPFHMWSPDIYQGAPTPVTTFLAVGSKAAALAIMVRVMILAFPLPEFNWAIILAVLAAITIVAGNLIAMAQKNVKRMLAYSSIAQAGYMLAGLVAANEMGLQGLLFYALLYVFSNSGAFAIVIGVENAKGSSDRTAFNGLARRSPFMAMVMTVCLLSLAGIPPLAGFVGKFFIFSGVISAGYLWLTIVALIMSMISVYYYLLVVKAMYIGEDEEAESSQPLSTGYSARIAMWVCLIGTILMGIYPQPLAQMAAIAVSGLFM